MTCSLAIEYGSRGFGVNDVSVGAIRTPMHGPEAYEAMAALHPIGRAGEISNVPGHHSKAILNTAMGISAVALPLLTPPHPGASTVGG